MPRNTCSCASGSQRSCPCLRATPRSGHGTEGSHSRYVSHPMSSMSSRHSRRDAQSSFPNSTRHSFRPHCTTQSKHDSPPKPNQLPECHPQFHTLQCGHMLMARSNVPCGLNCAHAVSRPGMPIGLFRYKCRYCREESDARVVEALEKLGVVVYARDVTEAGVSTSAKGGTGSGELDREQQVPLTSHSPPRESVVSSLAPSLCMLSSFSSSTLSLDQEVAGDLEPISLHERAIPNDVIAKLNDPLLGYKFHFLYESNAQIRPAYVLLLASSVKGRLEASGIGYAIVPPPLSDSILDFSSTRSTSESKTCHTARTSHPGPSQSLASASSLSVNTQESHLHCARTEIKAIVHEVECAQSARVQKAWMKVLENEVNRRREGEGMRSGRTIVLSGEGIEDGEDDRLDLGHAVDGESQYDMSKAQIENLWEEIFELLGARATEAG